MEEKKIGRIFVVYGILIGALSVWILNGALFFVHIYKLYQLNNNFNKLIKFNFNATTFARFGLNVN